MKKIIESYDDDFFRHELWCSQLLDKRVHLKHDKFLWWVRQSNPSSKGHIPLIFLCLIFISFDPSILRNCLSKNKTACQIFTHGHEDTKTSLRRA